MDVIAWARRRPELTLGVIGALLFLPYLGAVHLFDWDELNFAEAAREMILTGEWLRVQIDFQPFWEKPPLFIWLQALSMLAFGVNEFAARLPNALVGIVTLILLYRWSRQLLGGQRGERLGWLWAMAYAGSMLPHFYFRSGIIDPLFNLLTFAGVVQLWRFHHRNGGWAALVWAGVWCGLAILTKGPVALLLTGLTWGAVWLVGLRAPEGLGRLRQPWLPPLAFVGVSAVAASVWFGVDWARNGPWFVQTFVEYQIRLLTTGDAGHSQPIYYHPLVLLIGCFPASVFVFAAMKRRVLWGSLESDAPDVHAFARWLLWLLIVVVTVFSLVQTKILHYSSLAYFPITGLAALTLLRLIEGSQVWRGYLNGLLIGVGLVWTLALLALPAVGLLAPLIAEQLNDPFTAGALLAPVQWSGLEFLIGVGFAVLLGMALTALAQGDVRTAVRLLFLGSTVTMLLVLPVLVPRVEGYSQRAAIYFYEQFRGCECYVQTLRYKSYGQYFYADRQERYSSKGAGVSPSAFEQWVLTGPIDRPAFLLTRVQDAALYAQNAELKEVYRAGGFVGFRRDPPKNSNLALRP